MAVGQLSRHHLQLMILLICCRCKKCRYEKCLSIGMDPKWVMTQEQKLVRFQHYYKKKQEKASATTTTPSTTNTTYTTNNTNTTTTATITSQK